MRKLLLTTVAVVSLGAAAQAATVYDNGPPNGANGNDATHWVQAEDFNIAGGATVNSANVFIAGLGGIGNYNGQFTYYIFADAGNTPGAMLDSGNVAPTVTDTGQGWCCGGDVYQFAFNLNTPFNAAAGTPYWFGIHLDGAFDRTDLYWVTTDPNGTPTGHESENGTFDNWSDNGQEHAFNLSGDTIGGGVPEPATWAMMLGGFGLLGAAMRRRSVRASVTYA